jgi:hypothetical protein
MSNNKLPCNLPLIFDIMKLYKEEYNTLYTNDDDIKMSTYFKSNYMRMITREFKKCILL